MEFVENRPENPHINYLRNPIAGVREIERLMDDLEPRLAGIEIPALVVQSSNDPVVDPRGSEKIFKRIGSRDKKYVLFSMDRHGILLGQGSEQVHQVVFDFLRQLN
jgi:esterase/lipase